jgi:hypothetical protein
MQRVIFAVPAAPPGNLWFKAGSLRTTYGVSI